MPRFLKGTLSGILTIDELKLVYSGFDIVGNIVVIKIPDQLDYKKNLIAEAILSNLKNVNTVLRQTSPVGGEYRIRDLEVIGGDEIYETTHKEHGCIFKVDLRKAYFSPRLSTERLRICNLVQPGETIVNMFAGIGCFSILIGKRIRNVKIYSIDINPDAYELMKENIKLNKVSDSVIPILGDASSIISKELIGVADRVLMLLPEKALDYFADAERSIKSKGIIHYYDHIFSDKESPEDKALERVKRVANKEFSLSYAGVVREVGPRWSQTVLDLGFT